MSDETTLEVPGLEKLLKALKARPPVARIGILGGSSREGGSTNAQVGAAHEFGTSRLPGRSFLREPLGEYLAKRLEENGALDEETLRLVLEEGSVVPWMRKVMITAEGVVADAFATGGFGKWPGWKAGYQNNTGNILVDTQQLRNSIQSEVKG